MDDSEHLVGATMKWRDDPCEIMELAIVPEFQRQGLGKQFVAWLIQEALAARGRCWSARLIQPTYFFYQVRLSDGPCTPGLLLVFASPNYENGIQIQDMLVFCFDFVPRSARKKKTR